MKAARIEDGMRQLRLESRFLGTLDHKNIIRAHGLSAGQASSKIAKIIFLDAAGRKAYSSFQ